MNKDFFEEDHRHGELRDTVYASLLQALNQLNQQKDKLIEELSEMPSEIKEPDNKNLSPQEILLEKLNETIVFIKYYQDSIDRFQQKHKSITQTKTKALLKDLYNEIQNNNMDIEENTHKRTPPVESLESEMESSADSKKNKPM